MLKFTSDEQKWLDAYHKLLDEQFPSLVETLLIYGSKARGEAGPDSDLDVLVVLREGDRETKRQIRYIGHRLAVMSEVVPSIMVYTREEWSARKEAGSTFYLAVTRDAVRIA
ncbi:MAG: nucleotidyltransferase domain-containing protein [Deltaproteobacteria bacterium]|nr:nucleotidyltransferase domain-containing protein [Deltaproteobacteria bacterium]